MNASVPPNMFSHEQILSILARADADRLKAFAQKLIEPIGEINVLKSRTGLVMLPMRDTAQGTAFHLGEVLVSEAHIKSDKEEGYGMRQGRDLEAAMAMALIDLAISAKVSFHESMHFIHSELRAQQEADHTILSKVEATRVDMETF